MTWKINCMWLSRISYLGWNIYCTQGFTFLHPKATIYQPGSEATGGCGIRRWWLSCEMDADLSQTYDSTIKRLFTITAICPKEDHFTHPLFVHLLFLRFLYWRKCKMVKFDVETKDFSYRKVECSAFLNNLRCKINYATKKHNTVILISCNS